MGSRKTYHSLHELSQLLSDGASKPVPAAAGGKGKPLHDGKRKSVRIFLDVKGRKGKNVTVIAGLQHNPDTMQEIARILKQHCGAGGTVKEGMIEIQGDNRARVKEKLEEMNYLVKQQ